MSESATELQLLEDQRYLLHEDRLPKRVQLPAHPLRRPAVDEVPADHVILLGIEQHRAPADANPDESAKRGYLPEAWVVQQVEAAGFKLAKKSEVNANPKDTKDYPDGVWSLPPTLRQGDTDRAKYVAIGESDRMTLRFVKVAPKSTAELKAGG